MYISTLDNELFHNLIEYKGAFDKMSGFKVHTIHEQVVILANHNQGESVKYHVCHQKWIGN